MGVNSLRVPALQRNFIEGARGISTPHRKECDRTVAGSESDSGSGTLLIEGPGLSGLGIEQVEVILSRAIRFQRICRSVQCIGDMDTILRAGGAGYSLDGSGLERCESVLFLNRGRVGLRLNRGGVGLRLNREV